MQKMKKKTRMNELEPDKRINDFQEVKLGYSEEEAIKEASRCIQCNTPLCVKGCPVKIDIEEFIRLIKEKKINEALAEIKKTSNLPGICGRVCPQENQCEKECILGKKFEPVAIGNLERFAADNGKTISQKTNSNGKKIAIVGSGPAGLTCASDLAVLGHDVTIFEALHKAGGVLMYGIPEFRLPKKIVKEEVDVIKALGVKIKLNQVIGKLLSLKELENDFDAVFLCNGAGLPMFLGILGENLVNVYSSNEYLVRNNLMKAYLFPDYDTPIKKGKNVVVVGGGNVAVDAARVARRLGAEVIIVYRRTRKEMPARIEEIEHALEEGIKIHELIAPLEILGEGQVTSIKCQKMQLGKLDSSGRRKPIPIEGEEIIVNADEFIIAIGQKPNPLLLNQLKESNIDISEKSAILVNENMQTSNRKFFAGGDIVGGNATVIKAMGDGKIAAKAIDEFLTK